MMTIKFYKEKKKELMEYIDLRMKKMYEKYNERIISNNEFQINFISEGKYKVLVVHTKYYTIEIPKYVFCSNNRKDYYYNILEKIYNDDPFKEITEYDFIYVDYCLNEIEAWLATINEKVKEDEKKIQEALDNLEFYQLYKSQKVIQKLENKEE